MQKQYSQEYFEIVNDNLQYTDAQRTFLREDLRRVRATVGSVEVRKKAGLPLYKEHVERWIHATQLRCVLEESVQRWEMTHNLIVNDIHDWYTAFAMERDELQKQTKHNVRMVTPQDLMVRPCDLMQLVTPRDLRKKRVRCA